MVLVDFREDYVKLIDSQYYSEDEVFIVKVVDVFCVYLKMLEELNLGNCEFILVKKRFDQMLKDYYFDEVDYFLKCYVFSFLFSLDEIIQEDMYN